MRRQPAGPEASFALNSRCPVFPLPQMQLLHKTHTKRQRQPQRRKVQQHASSAAAPPPLWPKHPRAQPLPRQHPRLQQPMGPAASLDSNTPLASPFTSAAAPAAALLVPQKHVAFGPAPPLPPPQWLQWQQQAPFEAAAQSPSLWSTASPELPLLGGSPAASDACTQLVSVVLGAGLGCPPGAYVCSLRARCGRAGMRCWWTCSLASGATRQAASCAPTPVLPHCLQVDSYDLDASHLDWLGDEEDQVSRGEWDQGCSMPAVDAGGLAVCTAALWVCSTRTALPQSLYCAFTPSAAVHTSALQPAHITPPDSLQPCASPLNRRCKACWT